MPMSYSTKQVMLSSGEWETKLTAPLETRRILKLPHDVKKLIKHTLEGNPNSQGYQVGQEKVAQISGHDRGLRPGKLET